MCAARAALPMAAQREALLAALREADAVVVGGDTGCGKTTQVRGGAPCVVFFRRCVLGWHHVMPCASCAWLDTLVVGWTCAARGLGRRRAELHAMAWRLAWCLYRSRWHEHLKGQLTSARPTAQPPDALGC